MYTRVCMPVIHCCLQPEVPVRPQPSDADSLRQEPELGPAVPWARTETSQGSHTDSYATLTGPAFKITSEISEVGGGRWEEGAQSPVPFSAALSPPHKFMLTGWCGLQACALSYLLTSIPLQVLLSPGFPAPPGRSHSGRFMPKLFVQTDSRVPRAWPPSPTESLL